MRIMGLDFGEKTVGIAISDELLLTAQGIEIVRREQENKLRRTLARIEELIVQYDVTEIVLGLPRNMNATDGQRTAITEEFREKLLRRTDLPVHLWDERLTTVAATRAMDEAGLGKHRQKEHVDRIAAQLILQSFLDLRQRNKKEPE
jgi:putative Holliday junction resolvase